MGQIDHMRGTGEIADDWLFIAKGVPEHIRSDNGPEFTANAVRNPPESL